MACPQCNYPNDETFRFCQQCGYQRPFTDNARPRLGTRLKIDEELIEKRRQELRRQRESSRYTKQKSSLEREFTQFLDNRTSRKTMASAAPEDVVQFLIWKDNAGRTKVHRLECLALSRRGVTCSCPTRLAHGTVDSLIGKLLCGKWQGIGMAFPPGGRESRCLSLGQGLFGGCEGRTA